MIALEIGKCSERETGRSLNAVATGESQANSASAAAAAAGVEKARRRITVWFQGSRFS